MEDKRIERLFEYTKFHIGLYMTVGAGLVALIAGAADVNSVFHGIVANPKLLIISVLFMATAGLAGGVIASSLTQINSFDEFWTKRQGPWSLTICVGKYWTWIEHTAFWSSIIFAAASLLGGNIYLFISG